MQSIMSNICVCLCRELRRQPSAEMMQLWRKRVGDCIGYDWDRTVTVSPPTIVVIDRAFNASRHIINIDEVMTTLIQQYPTANVELHHLEGLSLKQQAVIYNKASVKVWVHGASMANLIFLPKQAVGLHIVPRPHIQKNMDWPQEFVRDLATEVKIIICQLCLGCMPMHNQINSVIAARQYAPWMLRASFWIESEFCASVQVLGCTP